VLPGAAGCTLEGAPPVALGLPAGGVLEGIGPGVVTGVPVESGEGTGDRLGTPVAGAQVPQPPVAMLLDQAGAAHDP